MGRKSTVFLDAARTRMGVSDVRQDAVPEAERTIEKAIK